MINQNSLFVLTISLETRLDLSQSLNTSRKSEKALKEQNKTLAKALNEQMTANRGLVQR